MFLHFSAIKVTIFFLSRLDSCHQIVALEKGLSILLGVEGSCTTGDGGASHRRWRELGRGREEVASAGSTGGA